MFTGTPAIPEMVSLAQRAERNGFESVWIAETRITRDAFVPAAVIAHATETIRIGTGIVNVYTRNPVLLAISFLGLNELAPGRTVVGLGSGSPLVLAPQGIEYHKPLTRLREYSDAIRQLMRGDSVTVDGDTVTLRDARIEDVLSSDGEALRAELPLYLAANGPKAVRYAGGAADGLLTDICLSTEVVEEKLEVLLAGARAAGRTREEIDVGAVLLCSPHEDEQIGREAARPVIGLYLGAMPSIGDEIGLAPDLCASITQALYEHGPAGAARLVPDEAVDRLAAAGTPAQCLKRIDEYRAAGADFVVLAPVETAIESTVDLLALTTQSRG
jgi:5,10-methylenetetrahydromethanopterin reductase